jgi:UDP-N-acetylmuramyl pentapeptide phosphotransferase/UDP-N-acetylglucosamine-1-phosphate transferase
MIPILKESFNYLFISTVASIIFAPIMITILYRFNQVSGLKKTKLGSSDGTNSTFMRIMNATKTNGTPNMGGVLIWILSQLSHTSLSKITTSQSTFIGFILFGLWD